MLDEDRRYFERRVSEELDRAYSAASPEAVKAHYGLLALYLEQLYGPKNDMIAARSA